MKYSKGNLMKSLDEGFEKRLKDFRAEQSRRPVGMWKRGEVLLQEKEERFNRLRAVVGRLNRG